MGAEIIYRKSDQHNTELIVCKSTEDLSYWKSRIDEQALIQSVETYHPNRQTEIICSHWLISKLIDSPHLLNFKKDQFGKPQLIDSPLKMSLSHSKIYNAAVVSSHAVGIDIQYEVDKIFRIQNKFLSDRELASLDKNHLMEAMHVCWGAKESMYKAYGKKKVTFKTELLIDPFNFHAEGGKLTGRVIKSDFNETFTIFYEKIESYYLVHAIADHFFV